MGSTERGGDGERRRRGERERERERERNKRRERDRPTETDTDRKTKRGDERDRQTYRETDTERRGETQTERLHQLALKKKRKEKSHLSIQKRYFKKSTNSIIPRHLDDVSRSSFAWRSATVAHGANKGRTV